MNRPAALAGAGLALAAAAAVLLAPDEGALLVAVSADEVSALTGRAPADSPELWERLKAMGLSAAVLREESLSELAERGEVLHVTRAEVEKWRALGVVSPGSSARGDALWARDEGALARAAEALAARGVDASTGTAGAMKALLLPPGLDLARVPAGFAPAAVTALSAAQLLPVAASTGPVSVVARVPFWKRGVPVDAAAPALRRAAFGRSRRLVVLRLRLDRSLEDNLVMAREALRRLRSAGRPSAPPEAAPAAATPGVVSVALFYLLGLFGPLFAARVGLSASRAAASPVCRWGLSQASPVPQAAAGALAAWAAASGAGFVAAWLLPPMAREDLARSWTTWTYAAPAAVAAAALYLGAGTSVLPGWRASLRMRHLAALAALAAVAALLLMPRAALGAAGLWETLSRFGSAADRLWWWPWRWREALVGVPCLLAALALVETAEPGRQATGFADPRGWLVFGLLAPSGAVAALGAGPVPPAAALGHGLAALLMGGLLAAAVAAARAQARVWAQGPRHDRTIDPDAASL
ncbi:MAG: hypothetical protein SF051_11795 [Elusimicrobiota bacterium]|nr:hypothetical protein [Elusimicrobiota bacterium]